MDKSIKRALTLLLTLSLVLGVTLSFTSCLSSLDDLIGGVDDMVTPSPDDTEKPSGENNGNSQKPDGDKEEVEDNNDTPTNDNAPDNNDTVDEEDKSDINFYPGSGEESLENLSALNKTLLSTVVISARFGSSPSAGSGVIYKLDKETGDAYILTSFHVIYNSMYGFCDSALLYLYGMQSSTYVIEATVLGGSAAYDIAVLKVEGSEVLKRSYAVEAELGNSEDVRVFDKVAVVGNAEGYGMSATMGIISVESEKLAMTGATGSSIELRVMRVDAAINQGNSGGGLYSEDGKLVGVVCAKRTGSNVDNMGYAIPVNLAKNLAENIIYNCNGNSSTRVMRAYIGVTITAKVSGLVIDPETGEMWEENVVEVSELTSNCIVKGEVFEGDVINSLTVDGVTVKVTRAYHVTDHMLNARVGSTVTMNLTRNGETFDVTVTVPESAISIVK